MSHARGNAEREVRGEMDPKLPTPKSDQARQLLQLTEREWEQVLVMIQSPRSDFRVIVFGQSPDKATPMGDKRKEIIAELRSIQIDVVVPEETPPEEWGPGGLIGFEAGLVRHRATYLAIALWEDSTGAAMEAASWSRQLETAHKFYHMAPYKYKGAYSDLAFLQDIARHFPANVYWYLPQELLKCSVKAKAVQKAVATFLFYQAA
jgi:hypothetical protein